MDTACLSWCLCLCLSGPQFRPLGSIWIYVTRLNNTTQTGTASLGCGHACICNLPYHHTFNFLLFQLNPLAPADALSPSKSLWENEKIFSRR